MHAFKCCKRLPIAATWQANLAEAVHLCCQNTLDQNGVIDHAMTRRGQLLVALLVSVDDEVVLLPTWGHHRSQCRSEELWTSGIVDVKDAMEFSLVDDGESRICMGQNE